MSKKTLIKLFSSLAILEGLSFLAILFLTMPLKYLADMPTPNQYVGYAHGFLFIAYVVAVFLVKQPFSWDNKTTFYGLLASIIPFGTFYFEKKYVPKV